MVGAGVTLLPVLSLLARVRRRSRQKGEARATATAVLWSTDVPATRDPHSEDGRRGGPPLPRRITSGLRLAVGVEVVLVLVQAVLAGQIVTANEVARAWHEANAYLILLLAVVQLVLTTIIWRRRGSGTMAGVALLLLAAVMLQMHLGYARQLAYHLPIGVAIFGLSVTLLLRAPRPVPAG
jgi:hypothetical protein